MFNLQATPEIEGLIFYSDEEKRGFQSYMLSPLTYTQKNGNPKLISEKKKLYYWFRLKGHTKSKAARSAGYADSVVKRWTGKRREKLEETKTVSEYFHLKRLNQDYIKDKVVEAIEESSQWRDKISALKLATRIMGMLKDSLQIRTIQDDMPVVFQMWIPNCPACGYDFNSLEAKAAEAKAEHVQDGYPHLLEEGRKGAEE